MKRAPGPLGEGHTNPHRLGRHALAWLAAAALVACGGASSPDRLELVEEDGPDTLETAPIDYGPGPNVALDESAEDARQTALGQVRAQAIAVPTGPADAHQKGVFGDAFSWPIIPLHTVLLPDGRVLSYGTKPSGIQGGQLHYAIWDPAQGMGSKSKLLLEHSTGTDIFCAGQALLPASGDVLLVGGDRLVNGQRNYANRDVNLFTGADNAITKQTQSMVYQRWYATVVTTASGELAVIGGRDDRYYEGSDTVPPTEATYASTPEVYSTTSGWRTLTTAKSDHAYGAVMQSWNYPRAWWSPDGRVVSVTPAGKIFALDVAGTGKVVQLTGALPKGAYNLPAVMYQPGKILHVREAGQASLVDINGATPAVSAAAPLSADRQFGNTTVLADGKVWANGGSSTGNDLVGAYYHSEMWDPATGTWTLAASAAKARLYHSIAMLMPDGSVLTGGGGAPGPVKQLNAELYFPPYLYKPDGSGQPATRPVINEAPTSATWGAPIKLVMNKSSAPVARLTLVRFGAVTHAFHNEQRFQDLAFTQSGRNVNLTLPASANLAPPGFYMLFALDAAGVPSKAAVIRIG
jgi:Domain of unknown function (DUF1929)